MILQQMREIDAAANVGNRRWFELASVRVIGSRFNSTLFPIDNYKANQFIPDNKDWQVTNLINTLNFLFETTDLRILSIPSCIVFYKWFEV